MPRALGSTAVPLASMPRPNLAMALFWFLCPPSHCPEGPPLVGGHAEVELCKVDDGTWPSQAYCWA